MTVENTPDDDFPFDDETPDDTVSSSDSDSLFDDVDDDAADGSAGGDASARPAGLNDLFSAARHTPPDQGDSGVADDVLFEDHSVADPSVAFTSGREFSEDDGPRWEATLMSEEEMGIPTRDSESLRNDDFEDDLDFDPFLDELDEEFEVLMDDEESERIEPTITSLPPVEETVENEQPFALEMDPEPEVVAPEVVDYVAEVEQNEAAAYASVESSDVLDSDFDESTFVLEDEAAEHTGTGYTEYGDGGFDTVDSAGLNVTEGVSDNTQDADFSQFSAVANASLDAQDDAVDMDAGDFVIADDFDEAVVAEDLVGDASVYSADADAVVHSADGADGVVQGTETGDFAQFEALAAADTEPVTAPTGPVDLDTADPVLGFAAEQEGGQGFEPEVAEAGWGEEAPETELERAEALLHASAAAGGEENGWVEQPLGQAAGDEDVAGDASDEPMDHEDEHDPIYGDATAAMQDSGVDAVAHDGETYEGEAGYDEMPEADASDHDDVYVDGDSAHGETTVFVPAKRSLVKRFLPIMAAALILLAAGAVVLVKPELVGLAPKPEGVDVLNVTRPGLPGDPTDPVTRPVIGDPTTDPVTDPNTDPIVDPGTPVNGDPTDPKTDPVVDPETDPMNGDPTDPNTDPNTDPTVDPNTDPTDPTNILPDGTPDGVTPVERPVLPDPGATDPVVTDPGTTDPESDPTNTDPVVADPGTVTDPQFDPLGPVDPETGGGNDPRTIEGPAIVDVNPLLDETTAPGTTVWVAGGAADALDEATLPLGSGLAIGERYDDPEKIKTGGQLSTMFSVEPGVEAFTQLANGNFFIGPVKKMKGGDVTLRQGDGEVTLAAADITKIAPLANTRFQKFAGSKGNYVRLTNHNLLQGTILQEGDLIILESDDNRVLLPRSVVEEIGAINGGGVTFDTTEDQVWLRKLIENQGVPDQVEPNPYPPTPGGETKPSSSQSRERSVSPVPGLEPTPGSSSTPVPVITPRSGGY